MGRRPRTARALAAGAALAGVAAGAVWSAGCNLVLGIEELPEGTGAAGSGGSGGATTGTASTGGTCGAAETPCNGTCVHTDSDPKSCGACGRDCLGGACKGAECQPVVLASGLNTPTDLVLRDQSIYFTTAFEVSRISLLDGKKSALSPPPGSDVPEALAVTATAVYWVTNSGKVSTVPSGGGTPVTLADTQGPLSAVTLGAGGAFVYWVSDKAVMSLSTAAGSQPQPLLSLQDAGPAQGQGHALRMAVDSSSIYWSCSGNCSGVYKVSLAGQMAQVIDSSPFANGVAVDANAVYWTEGAAGKVMQAPLAGGSPTQLASGQPNPERVALDKDHVYWTNYVDAGKGGAVMRTSIGGKGNAEVIAPGQVAPFAIAVDDKSVVWSTGHFNTPDGTVMRLRLPDK